MNGVLQECWPVCSAVAVCKWYCGVAVLSCIPLTHNVGTLCPRRSKGDGDYEICDDFIIDDWLRKKLNATEEELVKEKECVGHLIGIQGAACRIGPGEDTMLPGEN